MCLSTAFCDKTTSVPEYIIWAALKGSSVSAFMEIHYEKTKERYHYTHVKVEKEELKRGYKMDG